MNTLELIEHREEQDEAYLDSFRWATNQEYIDNMMATLNMSQDDFWEFTEQETIKMLETYILESK